MDALGTRPQNQADGKGACGAAKFTPRGTTYVFVNVVVAPRYVARLRLGSGGLKEKEKKKEKIINKNYIEKHRKIEIAYRGN